MKGVATYIKSLGAAATVFVSYVDHNLSPLFWALLILASVDVLLNVHKEGQQWQKLGSAFVSVGGTMGLAGHMAQPDFLRVLVAVATLAYLQVVVPQITALIGKIKWTADAATNTAIQQSELAALKAEVARLQSQAQKQASGNPPAGGNLGV